MFGYATNETESLMPAPIYYAHKLVQRQAIERKNGTLPWLRPDAKSQITFRYEDNRPVSVEAVVLSTQHAPEIGQNELEEAVMECIIGRSSRRSGWPPASASHQPDRPLRHRRAARRLRPDRPQDHRRHLWRHGPPWRRRILGQGSVKGGPLGRLRGPLGGEEHRRRRARDRCEIQISYAIGVAEPTSITVETFGTGKVSDQLTELVRRHFDLTPYGIIQSWT
jgi:S-adenosylmethionine synthetase